MSVASKKQSAGRPCGTFFDGMVTRHAIALNPALSVRGERYQVLEGKTPEISDQASSQTVVVDQHR
jgi:hypothetical protein